MGEQRATRLLPDFSIPDEWIEDALRLRPDWPDYAPIKVFESFKDYWISKSGKDATKLDWRATWRNWCRRENGFFAISSPDFPKLFEKQRREAMDQAFREFLGTD